MALVKRDYVAAYRQLRDELEGSPSVSILKAEEGSSVDDDLAEYIAEKLETRYGYELPGDFRDFFAVSRHTRLRYIYHSDGEIRGGGEFHLYPISDCLISLADPGLWYEGMSSEQIEILKTFRVIDDHPDSGDFKLSAFSIREGVSPPAEPEIFFYDRGDHFRMRVGYGGYLDALLDTMAVSNWQYLLSDVDLRTPEHSHVYEKLSRALGELSALFPKRDFSKFQGLLDESRQ